MLVSSDRTPDDIKEYMKSYHGSWLAVPHDPELETSLRIKYNITSIPSRVICRLNGSVIKTEGMDDVQKSGADGMKLWLKDA